MMSPASLAQSSFAPVWPGPSLLVPVIVECLLVGEPDRTGSTWALTSTNYEGLAAGFGQDASPPFTPRSAAPGAGAHLMWTMPYALRHGLQGETGAVEFPLVPNRWLVLRAQYAAGGGTPVLSAGVIQADLLAQLDTPQATSQYPDPTDPSNTMAVGGYFSLEKWAGPAGPAQPFLQAVGPGDVSWAVAYDNVRNVFSFYDALPAVDTSTYSYLVLGWYADPTTDPLYTLPIDSPENWTAALSERFNWAAGQTLPDVRSAEATWTEWRSSHGLASQPFDPSKLNLPPQLVQALTTWTSWQSAHGEAAPEPQPSLPRQMVCHGLVAQIPWSGSGTTYGTGAPGNGLAFPAVAVGNTAMEAIGAWLAKLVVGQQGGSPDAIPRIEQAIEAFQKGLLLDLEKDPAAVEAQLHAAEFEALTTGNHWIVVRPESGETPTSTSGQTTIPLNPSQTKALIDLNAKQASRDAQAAVLASQRSELFALVYKNQPTRLRPAPAPVQGKVRESFAAMKAAIASSQTQLAAKDALVASARASLLNLLGNDYVLRCVNASAAHAPADLVLLVAGAKTDTKFAAPGTYDDATTLPCRFTGQTITGLVVSYEPSGPLQLSAEELLKDVTLPQGQAIPKEAQDLFIELLLLDTGAAPFLARTYFSSKQRTPSPEDISALTAMIQEQQMAPWTAAKESGASASAIADAANLVGVLPAQLSVAYRTGQPWTPIFMDWKVSWLPTSLDPTKALAGWELGTDDYAWKGPALPSASANVLQGRTVLNPKIAQDIGAKLAEFVSDPDYAGLDQFIRDALLEMSALMSRSDVLTQSMGGLTQQLITQVIAPNQDTTDASLAGLLGDSPMGFRPVAGDYNASQAYFPIRSGFVQVLDLWVVDSYGQILRGKDPSLNAPIPGLIRSTSVTAPGDPSYVKLAPRISQPSSVDFALVDADDDGILSNSSDETSPICGFVVPNHLSTALSVFDAAGNALGSVLKVQTDTASDDQNNTALRWDAPPGSDAPLGAPPQIPNPHLRGFIQGLLREGLLLGGAALDTLLDHIDSSLWTMSALGQSNGTTTALIGASIAVVRAKVSLGLLGMPVYNQSWPDTGSYYNSAGKYAPRSPSFVSVPFGVRVGDTGFATNGVLGYCVGDDYSRFYAVYGSSTQTAPLRRALARGTVARGGLAALLRDTAAAPTAGASYVETDHLVPLPLDGTETMMTLLMDPRGMIPIISGVQPMSSVTLAPGPVSIAEQNMKVSFRMGPLLTDPKNIRMPLPSEVQGNFSWIARSDVTGWAPEVAPTVGDAVARLGATPPRLSEGFLTLSGALGSKKSK